jgi:hypothetical protein
VVDKLADPPPARSARKREDRSLDDGEREVPRCRLAIGSVERGLAAHDARDDGAGTSGVSLTVSGSPPESTCAWAAMSSSPYVSTIRTSNVIDTGAPAARFPKATSGTASLEGWSRVRMSRREQRGYGTRRGRQATPTALPSSNTGAVRRRQPSICTRLWLSRGAG